MAARDLALGRTAAAPARRGQGLSIRPSRADADFVVGRAGADLQGPRGFTHLLLVIVVAFFAIFFAWASWAELDEVTRGDGRVIPSRQVQVVQNLEGGIVAAIVVREGEIVEQGQVLLRIDNVRAASDLRENRAALPGPARRARPAARRGRGDRDLASRPRSWPRRATSRATSAPCSTRARRRCSPSSRSCAARPSSASRSWPSSRPGSPSWSARTRSPARSSRSPSRSRPSGWSPRSTCLRLQREVNDLAGELETARLIVPRIETALREAQRRIEERFLTFRAEAQRELNAVQAEAAALAEVITAAADRVQRTDVRSPVRGTIKRLLITTLGGVVQPGEDLVEIVPLEDTLLVEAKVRPADIAFLRPGQPAMVKVTAYDFSIYGGLEGVVEDISADTIADDKGESFYRVRVRTHDNALEKAGEPLPIIPGMTTQVDILTGEKTVMDYLLKPILRAKDTALRER